MANLFFYREERKDGSFVCSFNTDYVIRTVGIEDGKSVVLLDDVHEQYMPVQVQKGKTTLIEQRKQEVCSEIYLSAEDTKRFIMYNGGITFAEDAGLEEVKPVNTLA